MVVFRFRENGVDRASPREFTDSADGAQANTQAGKAAHKLATFSCANSDHQGHESLVVVLATGEPGRGIVDIQVTGACCEDARKRAQELLQP